MLIFNINNLKELPEIPCIYAIELSIDGRKYVGHTINLKKRMDGHFKMLNKNKHYNDYLQRTYNKYNSDNFKILVLEEVKNLQLLVSKEQYWADFYQSFLPENGFNYGECVDNPFRGQKHTEETKEKLRQLTTGREWTEKAKIAASIRRKGITRTEEDKEKIRAGALLGHNKEKKEVEVVSPEGNLIKIFGLRGFCRDNKLHRANFNEMLSGKIPHYKGWRLYNGFNLEPMIIIKKQSHTPKETAAKISAARKGVPINKNWNKVFFIRNDGTILETSNLSKLSRDINFSRPILSNLLRGLIIESQGMRLLKIEYKKV